MHLIDFWDRVSKCLCTCVHARAYALCTCVCATQHFIWTDSDIDEYALAAAEANARGNGVCARTTTWSAHNLLDPSRLVSRWCRVQMQLVCFGDERSSNVKVFVLVSRVRH